MLTEPDKGGSGKGGKGGASRGGKGGNTGNGGGNTSKGGDSSLSFSPTIPVVPRDVSPLGLELAGYLKRRQLQYLQRRQIADNVRRVADPDLFYNEIYARDAEADAEPDFELEDIYSRDAEAEADIDHIYARDAEPEWNFEDIYARDPEPDFESFFADIDARDLHLDRFMVMSS